MKTEALEVLKNRRSVRQYKAEQIKREELDAVLEAGTFAPTSRGRQTPVIVAVQDAKTVARLDAMNAQILAREGVHPYYGAPTILIVFAPKDDAIAVEDGALVAGNLLNAAYAAGLGSCWIHRAKEMFETPEGKELLKKWNVPENMMGVASVALGYADGSAPKPAPRKEGYILKV